MSIAKKTTFLLLIILFFLLPLINSHFFDLIGIKWGFYVDGNYEFTKVMFFNIFTGIISIIFLLSFLGKNNPALLLGGQKERGNIIIPKIIFCITFIILISTFFSSSFYTSLLGNSSKSHSVIMFLNLILLFIILINSDKKILNKLLKTTFFSSFFVVIFGIKEYYFPTFDYGNLSNRGISTLGHPNYLTLYVLVLVPFFLQKTKNKLKYIFVILLIFTLFLTKSAWGIIVFILYLVYKINNKKLSFVITTITLILSIILLYKFGLTTKLQSFLSRFFIWETTINIIFSDIKIFLLGGGLGTLEYLFDSFKSPYLYIFENIGFTADRPHNLFLNFFYHFGILGLSFIIYIFVKILKNFKKNDKKTKLYFESLILGLLFTIFNFPGITHYAIIILIGAIIYKNLNIQVKQIKNINNFYLLFILSLSLFGMYFSMIYYNEEHKIYKNSDYSSSNYFYKKILGEDFEENLFNEGFSSIEDMCNKKIKYSANVENYFYCGNLIWNYNEDLAITYYNKGLEKIPDLWNKNSKYNDNFFVKYFASKERFFSDKYSNLEEILERIEKY